MNMYTKIDKMETIQAGRKNNESKQKERCWYDNSKKPLIQEDKFATDKPAYKRSRNITIYLYY